jgi:hypothetical protein
MTYPNGRQINYVYGSGMDSTLNRVTTIHDATGAGQDLASYTYLGLGTAVRITYPQPSVWLDLWGWGGARKTPARGLVEGRAKCLH